ncbi:MAG TPA: hypothetical protein VK943_11130, partial [Arenibaculum sp.]|nr:hypothetical protein [Arenibaculum sp.]
MSRIPVVSVIGSCRVHVPLVHMADQRRIALHNRGLESYCHGSKEALQKIRRARGEIAIPAHLEPLVNGGKGQSVRGVVRPVAGPVDFGRTDAFVVEISSPKRFEIGGTILQQVLVRNRIIRRHGLEDWWSRVQAAIGASTPGTEVRPGAPNAPLPSGTEAMLRELVCRSETDEEIVADIARIVACLGKPVVFVGHMVVPGTDGNPIPGRERLNAALRHGAAASRARFCDPTDLIGGVGRARTLRPADPNHWAPDF